MANPFLSQSPNATVDKNLLARYFQIPLPRNKVQAMYVWIDGTGEDLCAKTRMLDSIPECPNGRCGRGSLIGISIGIDYRFRCGHVSFRRAEYFHLREAVRCSIKIYVIVFVLSVLTREASLEGEKKLDYFIRLESFVEE